MRCKEKKDLPEETLKDEVLISGIKRFRLEASVPKPVRDILKSSQSLKTLTLPNVWTGSHQVCDQPNFFHLEVKDRE